MQAITLRPLSSDDPLFELTAMLHRAFARLGRMGIACTCVDQTVAVTRQRIAGGACFVAECGGRIVGTITLYRHDRSSESTVYRSRRVASLRQFAVDPEFQGRGLGRRLLDLAEEWAVRHGYQELALDTPHAATHLLNFYRHLGFDLAEILHFSSRTYPSAILRKPISPRHLQTLSADSMGLTRGGLFPVAANDLLHPIPALTCRVAEYPRSVAFARTR